MMLPGLLSVWWCGILLTCQPAFCQTAHNASQAGFNHTQSSQLQPNQSEQTTSRHNHLGLNQSDHDQDVHSHEDPKQDGHTQDGYNQTRRNTSEVQRPAPERSLHWLGDCDTLPDHVNLSSYHLSQLSAALFNTSCAGRVSSMDLSYNQLSHLDPDLLTLLTWLRVLEASHNQLTEVPGMRSLMFLWKLDLSHNLLRSLPPDSLPVRLYYLDLSFNSLTQMVDGVFHGLRDLQHFDLSHNQIYDIQPGAFEARMNSVIWANFSYNQLTVFDAWPYIFSPYVVADLRHNHISRFTNRMNVTISNENLGQVYLSYNNVTRLDATDFSIYLNGKSVAPLMIAFYFKFNVQHNPFICDCRLHWIVDLLRGHLLSQNTEMYNFLTCATPPFLRGRKLGFLFKHGHLLVCEVLEGCPQGCQCMDTPHHGHVLVSCDPHLHTYTALPAELPAQGLVSLNLSRHALRHLEAGSCDVSRLKVLDVSHNQVSRVSSSFLDSAVHLEELDLRHNQLTSLPAALQRLAVNKLYVVGNPLLCSCPLARLAHWAKTLAHNMSQTVHVTLPNQTDTSYTVWTLAESDTDLQRFLFPESDDSSPEEEQYPDRATDGHPINTTTTTSTRLIPDVLLANCSLSDGRQVSLMDTSQWRLDCQSRHVNAYVLVLSGVMVVLVLVGVVIFWRWRYSFRVLVNYARSWCPACACPPKHNAGDEDGTSRPTSHNMMPITKKELVYVSIDEKDDVSVTWACQWLLPFLQRMGHKTLRVYLPLKEELPGVCTLENRAEVISSSHKFLVILTPGYSANGHCRQELDYACHHHQTRCHKNIVIVLKDDLPQPLLPTRQPGRGRRLVHNHTHGRYDNTNDDDGDDDSREQLVHHERPARAVARGEIEDIHAIIEEEESGNEDSLSNRDGVPPRGKGAVLRTKGMPVGMHDGSSSRRPPPNCITLHRNGEVVPPATARGPSKVHGTTGRGQRRKEPRPKAGRDRQELLEELSQFWEQGTLEAVEPLRSFLLQGRYLSASDRLFRQKLLFELSRK